MIRQRVGDEVGTPRGRVLWVCTDVEVAPRGGAALYSHCLALALAERGVDVAVFGEVRGEAPSEDAVRWHVASTTRRSRLRRTISPLPAMAASRDVGALRRRLAATLSENWDVVATNHLNTVWAVPTIKRALREGRVRRWWYVSQNDERDIWWRSVRSRGASWVERYARLLDLPRVALAQRSQVRGASLVSAITLNDLGRLAAQGAEDVVFLPPVLPSREPAWIEDAGGRPRTVVVAGSFEWSVKRRNLYELLARAVVPWSQDGISIVVAGRMSTLDLQRLRQRFPDVEFLGPLPDLRTSYQRGRLAVLHEPVGGGFKMKALSYMLNGLPLVATRGSVAGLPSGSFLEVPDVEELVRAMPSLIDDALQLDQLRLTARELVMAFLGDNPSPATLEGRLRESLP